MSEYDVKFPAMGSEIRLLIGEPLEPGLPGPAEAAARAREYVEQFDARLSRFRPDSELCAFNADPREEVPASALLRAAVGAGLWAAERTGGLVDPTLIGQLEAVGYRESRTDVAPAPLAAALACAPDRQEAQPHPDAVWRQVSVDDTGGCIRRPAGVRIDSGGAGKGLCADAVAHMLSGYSRYVVDCGGDMRIGGPAAAELPYSVEIQHPLTGECAASVPVGSGGIATSGIDSRAWLSDDGRFAHHLLDPSTGRPAWTGLISATALGDSALEAETLAKAAILSGATGARRLLRASGGAVVYETGRVELIGPLRHEPLMHVRLAPLRAVAA
jgi:thiamine biosynthesis lipoprotein